MQTFVIRDAAGNELRRETPVSTAIRPTTWPGETAELAPEEETAAPPSDSLFAASDDAVDPEPAVTDPA